MLSTMQEVLILPPLLIILVTDMNVYLSHRYQRVRIRSMRFRFNLHKWTQSLRLQMSCWIWRRSLWNRYCTMHSFNFHVSLKFVTVYFVIFRLPIVSAILVTDMDVDLSHRYQRVWIASMCFRVNLHKRTQSLRLQMSFWIWRRSLWNRYRTMHSFNFHVSLKFVSSVCLWFRQCKYSWLQ